MKKFNLLALLCATPLLLAGCDTAGAGSAGISGSEPAGSSQSSQSYLGPTSDENIMKDVCNALFGSAVKGTDYDDGYYGYGFGTMAYYEGQTSDDQVEAAAQDVISCLPTYLCADPEYPYEAGSETDSETGESYFAVSAYYITSDGQYCCDIMAYAESGTDEETGEAYNGAFVYVDVYAEADAEAFWEEFADLFGDE